MTKMKFDNKNTIVEQISRIRLSGRVVEMQDAMIDIFIKKKKKIYKISLSQIIQIIMEILPTCYGKIEVRNKLTPVEFSILVYKRIRNIAFKIWCKERHIDKNILNWDINKNIIDKDNCKHFHFSEGGSSSRVFFIKKGNFSFVRKISTNLGIEGNGIQKLIDEKNFIYNLNKNPKTRPLSNLYPKIISYSHDKSVYFDMEYIKGYNVCEAIDHSILSLKTFYIVFNNFLKTILIHGYLTRLSKASPNELVTLYLVRSKARIMKIKAQKSKIKFKHISNGYLNDILFKDRLIINNKECYSPFKIIEKLYEDRYSYLLTPRLKGFCAHGDATFVNIIYDKENNLLRVVDPRGHYGYWDILYDFGKMFMSFQGHYHITVGKVLLVEEKEAVFTVSLMGDKNSIGRFQEIRNNFFSLLENDDNFKKIIKKEPFWKLRIEFIAAIHLLADIPFKLHMKSADMAAASFLLGTFYLNVIFEKLNNFLHN